MNSFPPVVKWAGGKRWLISQYGDLFPTEYDRLVEPFLGGASIFLKLIPQSALLADLNSDLITTYKAIRDDWKAVEEGLRKHQPLHGKEHYYEVREENPTDPVSIAVRFLYLNRTCWNGLYRVNKNGFFNVPIGTKTNVMLPSDDFESFSKRLKTKVKLVSQSYEKTLKMVKRDDFVYIDPPYTVNHNKNGFLKYNESIFSWEDQLKLREAVENVALLGAKVIISQAHHHSIEELYQDIGASRVINRRSTIAASSKHRKSVEELLVSVNC